MMNAPTSWAILDFCVECNSLFIIYKSALVLGGNMEFRER